MGHANLSNLSTFLTRYLYAKGTITVGEAVANFRKRFPEDGVRASEGVYTEPYMISEFMWIVIGMWTGRDKGWTGQVPTADNPVVVVADDLTPEQQKVWDDWRNVDWEAMEKWLDVPFEDPTCGYQILDSVPLKFGPGWRSKYSKDSCGDIPQCGNFTN